MRLDRYGLYRLDLVKGELPRSRFRVQQNKAGCRVRTARAAQSLVGLEQDLDVGTQWQAGDLHAYGRLRVDGSCQERSSERIRQQRRRRLLEEGLGWTHRVFLISFASLG